VHNTVDELVCGFILEEIREAARMASRVICQQHQTCKGAERKRDRQAMALAFG
jgi:hypothetical protein